MKRIRISYGSAILVLLLAGCGGATNPVTGAQAATPRLVPAATYKYLASGGGGSGSYSWSHQGGEHCDGRLDYRASVLAKLSSSGKVEPDGSTIVATGNFDAACKAWGVTPKDYLQFTFTVSGGGHVSEKAVSVEGTVTDGFCLPGSASGRATLVGSVENAHLFITKIFEKCKDFATSLRVGKVLIHDIKGQLYSH